MVKKASIKIGDNEASIEGDEKALSRVSEVLTEIVSPLSEGFGALGDKIRVYRAKSALKALSEAKQTADELNIPLTSLKPKFLINWTESASAEDPADKENLTELWANLLVNTANKAEGSEIRYTKILAQLHPRHARRLNALAESIKNKELFREDSTTKMSTERNVLNFLIDDMAELLKTSGYSYDGTNILKDGDLDGDADSDTIKRLITMRLAFDRTLLSMGIKPLGIVINSIPFIDASIAEDIEEVEMLMVDYELLDQFGLVNLADQSGTTLEGNKFVVHSVKISRLGMSFYEAVSKPKPNDTGPDQ